MFFSKGRKTAWMAKVKSLIEIIANIYHGNSPFPAYYMHSLLTYIVHLICQVVKSFLRKIGCCKIKLQFQVRN